MNVSIQGPTAGSVELKSAILLYSNERGNQFATAHPVTADRAGKLAVGAGRPLDRLALIAALTELEANAKPVAEFLPPTVLGLSSSTITWWCPPGLRRVFFQCKELGGRRSAVVPHPGLIFQASIAGFSVFALKETVRPTPDSEVFEPPYFNTWDQGRICIGTAQVPRRIDVASIAGWEQGFFGSAFTHPNQGSKRVRYEDGVFAFWRDMLDDRFGGTYPYEVLVPMKRRVRDLVSDRKVGGAR
jgi:PRTRC genetic system protein B